MKHQVTSLDERFISEALDLARRGIALCSPNPCVGAVIVAPNSTVVGRGSHTYDGVKHGEVLALEEAREDARGATLYINLEPCFHTGRTGPCVDALLAAGVRRVVAAMADPNSLVSGKSFAKLKEAGVDVITGVLEHEARKLNEAFAKHVSTRLPLVILKAGMTLDGKIAQPSGKSLNHPLSDVTGATNWITSAESRAHAQQLRHASDAILVGGGTILADDPLLTDRTGEARRRSLLRVVLDSHLRLPLDSRLVKTAQEDVLVFSSFAEEEKRKALEGCGVRVEQIGSGSDSRPDLKKIIERLGALDICSLLIEGGAAVNGAALAAGVVDKIFFYYAPKILGGTASVPVASGPGFASLSDAAQIRCISIHRLGEDFAVEGYLRDPYAATTEIGP